MWWCKKVKTDADPTVTMRRPRPTTGLMKIATGEYEDTIDVLRTTRASLDDLIVKLDVIRQQAEDIVHSADIEKDDAHE